MSESATFLVDQCMFWLERARAGSVNAGRPEYWQRRCFEVAAQLIGAGCAPVPEGR